MAALVLVFRPPGSLYRDSAGHGRDFAHPFDLRAQTRLWLSRDGLRDFCHWHAGLFRLGPSHVHQRHEPVLGGRVFNSDAVNRRALGDQDVQLDRHIVGREDSLYDADVVCNRIRVAICRRWSNRVGAGPNVTRLFLPRYLFRDGALSPGHGRGFHLRNVRGDIFLVSENVWPHDERKPGQVSLLDYVPWRVCHLRSVPCDGYARYATTLFAI